MHTRRTVEKDLLCPRCGQKGTVVLEDREAISTSVGFYLKMKFPIGSSLHIACGCCGAIQPYPATVSLRTNR